MSTAYPIESQGIRSLSKVLQSPTLMGQGKGGEEWMCITCYEGLLDNRLYSIHKVERPKLPRLLTWLDYIVPEIRSLPNFPSMITLTSPQRHTVYLWIAVHRWIVYLCKNPKVKEELDKEVYVEKAFRGSGLFPALNSGKALYLDVATRDYKGCAPSGSLAELNWSQVLEQNLSEFLALSDDLVELREREALGTSSEDSEGSQEEWLDEEESRHNEEDEDEDDGGASTSESTEASPEEEPEAARHPGDRHSDTPSTNPGLETAL